MFLKCLTVSSMCLPPYPSKELTIKPGGGDAQTVYEEDYGLYFGANKDIK